MSISPLDNLIKLLSKLPGFGPRSARRAVLFLLKRRESVMLPLMEALQEVSTSMKSCEECGNWDVISPCAICQNHKREDDSLCVVEDVSDLWALERSKAFKGRYHILGGTLSALDGVRPADLRMDLLVERASRDSINEVILALSATVEGQTTSHYVAKQLENANVKVSRLAHGLPIGGELDYLDDGTLTAAFNARRDNNSI